MPHRQQLVCSYACKQLLPHAVLTDGAIIPAPTALTALLLASTCQAAVAACNTILAAAIASDPTADGNTRALQVALLSTTNNSEAAMALACLLVSECLLAPLAEEIVFRGVLLRSLLSSGDGSAAGQGHRGEYDSAGAGGGGNEDLPQRATVAAGWMVPVVVQAALFACYHWNSAEWPAQFVLGLALGAGYMGLQWYGGAPLAIGCATAAPVILAVGLLFLPSLDPGFTVPELRTISEVDEAEEAASFDISISTSSPSSPSSAVITAVPTGRGGVLGEGDSFSLQAPFPDSSEELEGPPLTLASLQRGLWLYQVQVLKPWFPEIRWSSVGLLFLASCAAAGSQELLVRGYGGSLLVGWYGHLLASATDVNNPIYWAKVFRLVTPDTARWMAAFSLLALQVALSSLSVQRASRFARTALNRVGRVDSKLAEEMGTVRGLVRVTALQLDDDDAPTVKGERDLLLEFPTAEERVTYWASLGVSVLLCGAMNYAWAASGSLLGSYTARVAIDGVVTVLQQLKEKQLPDRARWNEVRRQLQEEEEDEDKEEKRREEEKGVAAGTK
ncbi:hypothetical protein VOLCADRAFT_91137 [Volvox carteri f. nagariensis]|uniref:Uncharacterized protein upf1 n=1 Tax=Volvox carteri f. nagariensis TaxID=3068 RepID=D8TW98_VOLCA|nr:uncharacterized protein VOLCADRAFT_91137 [Volvox carteri f. nagariensis]EFJ48438.1 hypothetical protein VOLCADRAFT_91137 [Volvox carteri f. nagariensis]|eukprot:XP_002950692.1 hypothetical protein VOLCADRAFT_91137 [Volvox carteri f. nagariensis]